LGPKLIVRISRSPHCDQHRLLSPHAPNYLQAANSKEKIRRAHREVVFLLEFGAKSEFRMKRRKAIYRLLLIFTGTCKHCCCCCLFGRHTQALTNERLKREREFLSTRAQRLLLCAHQNFLLFRSLSIDDAEPFSCFQRHRTSIKIYVSNASHPLFSRSGFECIQRFACFKTPGSQPKTKDLLMSQEEMFYYTLKKRPVALKIYSIPFFFNE
jgi:hypothetical protein